MSDLPQFVSVDTILASRTKLKTKVLYTPDWGGYTLICELTGKQRDEYEAEMMSIKGKGRNQQVVPNWGNSRAKLVAKCIVDPSDFDITEVYTPTPWELNEGSPTAILHSQREYRATLKENRSPKRLFNAIQVNDLGDVSATTLQTVFDACRDLSGISEKDAEELETELKNGQNDSYGSN